MSNVGKMKKLLIFLSVAISSFGQSIQIDTEQGILRIGESDYSLVGFGTARMTGNSCAAALRDAMKKGYSIIDTATCYGNFDAVAKALKHRDRSEFYLISKVWHDRQKAEDVYHDLNMALSQLKTDYLDAYFIHWPNSRIPIEETLGAMEDLRRNGKIRQIGLSNVSANHVKRALETGVKIDWVQVEMNPFFCDFDLLRFCQEKGIAIQAWAPLGTGTLAGDSMLIRIGKKYGKTPSQVALRWILQHGCVPLPKSGNPKHIAENRDVFDFSLADVDMEEIDQRARSGQRTRFSKAGMGFEDEYDFSYEQCWPKKR